MDKKYLEKTPMLDYQAESIQSLIKQRRWTQLDDYHKIQSIYEFVQNEILFGYNRSDLLTAREVLQDGYGQCNTKATLLMALLRGVAIPCRLHGSEVSKHFQRGVTTGLIAAAAPETIVHTWAEVWYNGKWVALEGVITDQQYIDAVRAAFSDWEGEFRKYAIAVANLAQLELCWKGVDTFVQHEAVVKDFGVFDNPDVFFSDHPQKWSKWKNFAYVHYGRKVMNANVAAMRGRRKG